MTEKIMFPTLSVARSVIKITDGIDNFIGEFPSLSLPTTEEEIAQAAIDCRAAGAAIAGAAFLARSFQTRELAPQSTEVGIALGLGAALSWGFADYLAAETLPTGLWADTPKYVVSSTLKQPEWKNTTLLDTFGGSAVFYDSKVRVERAG